MLSVRRKNLHCKGNFIPLAEYASQWVCKPMNGKSFTERLRDVINNDPALNPTNLALKAGLDKTSIRQMLSKGASPRVDTAEKICEALGTTLVEFMAPSVGDWTKEERRIALLLSKLTHEQQLQLLGYGEALAALPDQSRQQDAQVEE